MRFEFATTARIVFGLGVLEQLGAIARPFGTRALVVTGKRPDRFKRAAALLADSGVTSVGFPVAGEPEIKTVADGVALARQNRCDLVVALGGGSALDSAKAIAAMLTNPGELLDYLEVIGRGQSLKEPAAPFIAIPTTAGTGAEVTRNAVLASPQNRVKVSLRSPLMLARVALVDPQLTFDLPPPLTITTGLDALTQLIEPFVCARNNPLTDALCREGMTRAARSLRPAVNDGRDAAAREDMALASLFGGLALANAGLGAVHGFAGPIGGLFTAPHGAVCAALLPHVTAANLLALQQRMTPGADTLRRYDQVAQILTGDPQAAAPAGVDWLQNLVADLRVPSLASYGLTPARIPDLVAQATLASSMKANPISLTSEELAAILQAAL